MFESAPKEYLSNLSIAYYESGEYAARRVFPVVPVALPSGKYYEFNREDLARDNVKVKPPYGSVQPAVFGLSEQSYSCKVFQVLIGLDKLAVEPYRRAEVGFDPLRARVKTVTEQIALHQEIEFSEKFFKASAWANVWTGAANANENQKKFIKFNSANSNPLEFLEARMSEIKRMGRRKPNKLVLGAESYISLKNNPNVLEKIKYSGTAQNPAVVTENVLAQMFGLESVIVLDTSYNDAHHGEAENMKFTCDSKGALLLYAPDEPAIDTPSAGYIFSWTLNGNDYITVEQTEGSAASHSDYLDGLTSYDMKKTSDAMAVFMAECC